jgi:hypothetical protein
VLAPELPADSSRVALLLVGAGGQIVESTGLLGPDALSELQIETRPDDIARFTLVAYRNGNLERLTLPDAETLASTPVEVDAETDAPLPTPDWAGTGPAIDGAIEIVPVRDPPSLTAAWAPRCAHSACERHPYEVEPVRITLNDSAPRHMAVRWGADSESALVCTSSACYRISPGRSESRVEQVDLVPTSSVAGFIDEGVLLSDGRLALWNLRPDGSQLLVGRPETGFTSGAPLLINRWGGSVQGRFASSPVGHALELLLATRDERYLRWSGRDWESLHEGTSAVEAQAHAVWLAPGRSAFAFYHSQVVRFFEDGRPFKQVALNPVAVVENLPTFGVLAIGNGFRTGTQLWRIKENYEVEELEEEELAGDVDIWISSDTQALIAGPNGEFSLFEPGLGNCELPRRENDLVLDAVQLPGGLLTISTRERSDLGLNFVNYYPKRTDEVLPACLVNAP